jgi:hypothetical protein
MALKQLGLTRSDVSVHRNAVKDFLRAYVEGIYVALSDGSRAKAVLAAEFKDFSPEVIQATYDDFKARVPRDAAPSRVGAETMLKELPTLGTPVKSANVADYVDSSLIEELRREGFFDAMKKKYRVE